MTETLAAALVAAQADMPAVAKDGTNPHFHSKFVSLDNLIAQTRPVLNKHGLAIAQFPAHNELGAPTLVTKLMHVSGESLEYAQPLFLPAQDMQKLGAAITYARRYGWASALGIASDDDDDGNHASAQPKDAKENGQPKVISDAQRKRLFAIAKEVQVDEDTIKAIVKQYTGSESTTAIPVSEYDAIVKLIQDQDVPF